MGYPPPDVHPRTHNTLVPYTMDDGVYISQRAGRFTPARRHGPPSFASCLYLLLTIACTCIADSSTSSNPTTFSGEERTHLQNQQLAISATSLMLFNTLGRFSDDGNSESMCTTSCSASFPPNNTLQLTLPCRPLRGYTTNNCLFPRLLLHPLTFLQYPVCSTVLKIRQSTEEPLIPCNAI